MADATTAIVLVCALSMPPANDPALKDWHYYFKTRCT